MSYEIPTGSSLVLDMITLDHMVQLEPKKHGKKPGYVEMRPRCCGPGTGMRTKYEGGFLFLYCMKCNAPVFSVPVARRPAQKLTNHNQNPKTN